MIDNEVDAQRWLRAQPEYTVEAGERIDEYVEALLAENMHQNLISRSSAEIVWQRHVADSAQLLNYVPRGASSWLDLGSGPGLPGLIVAILRPETEVVLVESRALRCAWLNIIVDKLGLTNVVVEECRVEALEAFPAGAISARAFAPLRVLLDLAARFSTSETVWVLPKGKSARQELQALVDWSHSFHVEQSLTDPSAGIITGTLDRKEVR